MTLPIVDQIIIILAVTVAAAALLHRFQIPTLILYLIVGLIAGPGATGLVTNVETYSFVAEFGIAFLLFTLGLEFSIPRLYALRKSVFGVGSVQVLICLGIFYVLIMLYGVQWHGALIAASAIALSSTAIVTKELSSTHQVNTPHGQVAIGILLFQDIAAVILLVIITAGGAGADQDLLETLGATLLKGIGYFTTLIIIGKYLLPPLFLRISATKSEELFVLTTLTVAISAAGLAHALGLAMALGAFVAGIMLGESHFRHQIENEIRPFRDVLLGLFFVTVGFMLDVDLIVEYWPRILLFSACLIGFKTILITIICAVMGHRKENALRTGIILSQGGEFGFALIAIGLKGALIPADVASFFVSIIVVSMAATPFTVKYITAISGFLLGSKVSMSAHGDIKHAAIEHQDLSHREHHVIILGYGRVGQLISRFLDKESIDFLALDDDPIRVLKAKAAGEPVYFGNARHASLLSKLGINNAELLVISFENFESTKHIIHSLREMGLTLPIIVRQRDDTHTEALLQAGATSVIPEINEASIMLVSQIMATLDVPPERIESIMQETRDDQYHLIKWYFTGRKARNTTANNNSEYIHYPIYLAQGAKAVGMCLADLNLSSYQVQVESIRRNNQVLPPPYDNVVLEKRDLMIVKGRPSDVEVVESLILAGVS